MGVRQSREMIDEIEYHIKSLIENKREKLENNKLRAKRHKQKKKDPENNTDKISDYETFSSDDEDEEYNNYVYHGGSDYEEDESEEEEEDESEENENEENKNKNE